jgi:hypothetical protein
VDRWHAISEFRGVKSRTHCIRIRDIAKSEIPTEVKGVEKSNSRVYRSFGKSGFGSRETSCSTSRCRNRDRENPEREKERSALTVVGFRGFERPTLDHWIREVAKSDLPSVKRGSRESLLWVQISR